jgi:hypothetical protein
MMFSVILSPRSTCSPLTANLTRKNINNYFSIFFDDQTRMYGLLTAAVIARRATSLVTWGVR